MGLDDVVRSPVRARIAMRKIDGMDGAGDAPTLAVVVL
jgi:hypothetical protein